VLWTSDSRHALVSVAAVADAGFRIHAASSTGLAGRSGLLARLEKNRNDPKPGHERHDNQRWQARAVKQAEHQAAAQPRGTAQRVEQPVCRRAAVLCRSCCAAGAGLLVPELESDRSDHTIGMGGKSVSTRVEVTVDEGGSGEEVLGLLGRFEPLHLSLSSSRRSMQVLGPIIQISALSVLNAGKQLTLSDAIAPQFVGHDHPRYIVQALQKPPEEAPAGCWSDNYHGADQRPAGSDGDSSFPREGKLGLQETSGPEARFEGVCREPGSGFGPRRPAQAVRGPLRWLVVGGGPQERRTAGSADRTGAHGGAASVAGVLRGTRTVALHNAAEQGLRTCVAGDHA